MKSKIVNRRELQKIIKDFRQQGKKVIATSGCFDLLHAGHVAYLEEAAAVGDILVVMLNSDLSVHTIKGKDRPIVNEMDRALVVAGLEAVDYVCIFDEDTPCSLIREIQPDVFVKGGDYKKVHIPEMDVTAEYGGTVEYVVLMEGHSTTNLIKRIQEETV